MPIRARKHEMLEGDSSAEFEIHKSRMPRSGIFRGRNLSLLYWLIAATTLTVRIGSEDHSPKEAKGVSKHIAYGQRSVHFLRTPHCDFIFDTHGYPGSLGQNYI